MAIKLLEKHLTGYAEIDNQHKELFSRINSLYEACIACKAKEEIYPLMKYLEEYTGKHFQTEEKYMEKFHYGGLQAHKSAHQQFIQIFKELKADFEKNGATTNFVIKINKTMINWLISHMGSEDKNLADFLKNKS